MNRPVALDVTVPTADRSYPVIVGPGVLDRVGTQLKQDHPRARRVAVISDDNVMSRYGARVRAALEKEDFDVVEQRVVPGETSKSVENLVALIEALISAGLGRSDAVVALGGGVVGDLAGLVAAMFMRGIAFVQCPTSLLAQVDASVGGKVAVDLASGKNLMGAFHFPSAVLIDPEVLVTLPDDELGCGLVEMFKHGLLFSREHVDALLAHADDLYARQSSVLGAEVYRSVALKAACVSRDPLERSGAGKGRVLLNLGHTVGHAIESASAFGLKHGQAVALGLLATARISAAKGLVDSSLERTIESGLRRLRLPTDLDEWLKGERWPDVARALAKDKKRSAKSDGESVVSFVALAGIGNPRVLTLPVSEILALLRAESVD